MISNVSPAGHPFFEHYRAFSRGRAEYLCMQQCPNCGCGLKRFEAVAYGNVLLDERGRILFERQAVRLPRTLHYLVEALIRARGRGLERGTLANIVGGDIEDATICKYIERARAAFRRIDPSFDQIVSLRGFGAYRWAYRSQFDVTLPGPFAGASASFPSIAFQL